MGTSTTEKGEVVSGSHVSPLDGDGTYKASSTYGRTDSKKLANDFATKNNIKYK